MTRAAATPEPADRASQAAPPPGVPALELDGLARRYGREWVLRDVSLRVAPGRLVALRGRNGSGKTTLLRVLATRLRPSRGRARVHGCDLLRDGHEARRLCAFLSVLGGNYPALTGRENLRLAARLRDRRDPPVEAALARVGLDAHGDRIVRTYSSGMKKRLGLARTLLADARVWLLDEPYAALDEEGRALVDGLLREARAEGRTVLLASHEADRVAPLVNGTLELDGGRIRRTDGSGEPA